MHLGQFELDLNVTDLKASRSFYERLGFRVVKESEDLGVAVLENGPCRIGLYQGHIAENLLNFRDGDIPAIVRQARSAGLVPEREVFDPEHGSEAALFRDPDGNAIYLVSHPDEAAA
jgi:catechol 2,3-dioxygenase-like lactoylglutathione lyase family enzyme